MAQGAVNVGEGVESECCRVMRVSDGRCFGASRAGRDDGCCARIESVDNFCGRKGRIDDGGEVEALVAEVGRDGRRV